MRHIACEQATPHDQEKFGFRYELKSTDAISIWTSNLACRVGIEPNQGDERMAIGLTFEEYVELKLMPPKHADRAFVTAAEQLRDGARFRCQAPVESGQDLLATRGLWRPIPMPGTC